MKRTEHVRVRATEALKKALNEIPEVKNNEHIESWMAHQLLEEALGLKPIKYAKFSLPQGSSPSEASSSLDQPDAASRSPKSATGGPSIPASPPKPSARKGASHRR